ncbi:MAG: hypothetical protein V7603_2687 [Micromonosporaceae bacterium]
MDVVAPLIGVVLGGLLVLVSDVVRGHPSGDASS